MQFSTLFAAAFLLAGTSLAQSNSSSSGMETVHVVQVGQGGNLTFFPDNVKANVGDLVQFQFWPKNHSVVQSTFAQPCIPIENVMTNITNNFYSGFMPTSRTASGVGSNTLTYTIRVTSTAPVWFYCSQGKHCQAGMVGAINAAETGEKTVAAFAALAAQAAENLSPGQIAGSTAGTAAGTNGTGTGANSGGTTLTTETAGAAATTAGTDAAATTAAATTTAAGGVAQQTTNAAPGNVLDSAKSGMVGVIGAAIAFLFL